MATTPEAGSQDPSVLRQIQRQNSALTTKPQLSAAPSVPGTSSTPTGTAGNNLRSLAPVVSGSDTLYPQSTATTSSNAITITSSISNDTGDVTTVYAAGGKVSATVINQNITQFTAVDSGVSQIVAGNGVIISSTGGSGTGVVTITSSAGNVGNIAVLNLDGNAANVLHGDGTWSADQTTYGNSNVAAYLPTYTGNIGGNVVTANLFAGNGSSLSAIAAANVTGLGNIATINLTGSTSNVLYGNGVFAPAAGGGNISELVNGNNSFVLDSDGNVVFEGNVAGQAVDRGLVWDYGANANGVNSMLRQDNGGLTLRAWTENGGGANGYSAPVSIITNQDTAAKAWEFDGQGNLTVPTGSINSINDGGDLGAYITLTPDLGIAKLAARDAQSSVNYTNISWSTATYTGTQIDFTNAPNLVAFFNTNQFNVGVNQTFSINGDEPVPFTGYSTGASNAVTVYTSITAEPDPTTVTSIDFLYQLESYVAVDYDGSELNINATGLTILIDNDQTEGPDIVLRSGDDITLQAKDMSLGSEREGGDINLNAGNGADDDGLGNTASGGGDIIIDAGVGGDGNSSSGGTGGFTQIRGGTGGTAGVTNLAGGGGYIEIAGGSGGFNNSNTALGASGGDVNIYGGDTTREAFNGADVNLTSGAGGANAFAGSVNISTPSSDSGPGGLWQFDGNGLLTLPDGAIIDTIGNNFEVRAVENVNFEANAVVNIYTDGSGNAYQWQFGDDGNLILPGNTFAVNYANGSPVVISGGSGNTGNVTFDDNIVIGTGDEFGSAGLFLAPGNGSIANSAVQYLRVRGGDAPTHIHLDTGNNQFYDQYFGDDAKYVKLELGDAGNVVIGTDDATGNSYRWSFTSDGNFILANGNSVIQSIANSSLDPLNPNVSTMVLTPDPSYSTQALVLDPTAPGHIHLRAPGANIDEPGANIFLGGEESSFEVGYYNGAAPNLFIHSGNNTWTFDNGGNLTLPGNLVYIGASPAPSISGFSSVSAEEFTNDTSNVTINANSNTWNFDSTGNLTIPNTSGGFIKTASNASIGIVAMDNGTNNPAQLLSMNVGNSNATSIVSAYATNVAIQTNASGAINTWSFDNAGNLTLPANTFAINYANGTQVSLGGGNISNISNGNSNVNIATANGNVTISAVGNTTMTVTGTGANVTGTLTSTGKIGYASGSTVTQITSRGTGVTINALAGTIVTTSIAMVANEIDTFSVINSSVDPNNDIVLAQIVSPNQGTYNCIANPALIGGFSNGFYINIVNISGFTTSDETITVRFMVFKAPNA